MKTLLPLFALIAGVHIARATAIFSDGFTYPDGNLVGAPGSPWNAHDAPDSLPVQVSAGRARIAAASSSAQDINVLLPAGPYPSAGPTSALYVGFKVNFSALPSLAGSYYGHFNTSGFRCRLWASTTGAAAGTFRLGIGNSSGASVTSGQIASNLALNADYLIVVRYELATGLSTIWLNPTLETDPGVTASDAPGTSLPSISAFSFRQASGIGIMLIDNLVIGTSFTDVVGGNLPPSISPIADQSIPAGGSTGPLPFALGDDQTPAADLTPTGTSDNQSLVPDGNIVFGGSDGNRTVTITPEAGQQGLANLTLSVSDGLAAAETSFQLRVGAPGIGPMANQITPVNTVFGPLGFMVSDAEEGAAALGVTGTSSNPALVPDGNIIFGGSGSTRTLMATPAAGQSGITTISVTVNDGFQTASTSFALTVHPVLGLLASDDFNRPDDFLVDWVNWISHSGPPGEIVITENRVPLSQHLLEDVNLPLTPGTVYPEEGGHVFYASFTANFSELPAGAGTYFAHFKDTTNTFRARVIATTTGAAAGALRLGIANSGSVASPVSIHPTDIALQTDCFVVVRLNAATGESRLWVNPSAEATGYVAATDFTAPSAVESFAFRQSGPSPGMGALVVDDLKVGTAFIDVAGGLPVPLAFTRSNSTLRLSWPTGRGFLLRRASTLPAAPAAWTNVPFVNEGANDVSNVDLSTGSGFFRLEKSN